MANWGNISSRGNVEDRRGMAPVALGGLSIGGVLILLLFNYLTGGNVTDVLNQLDAVPIEQQSIDKSQFDGQDSYEVFASTVLGSTNDMWKRVFQKLNKNFEEPKLVLFRQSTNSACGGASSDVGPHYCSQDKTIYLDETFFDEMKSRFGAKGGDVAEAYVMAHEAGHHAQYEMGILDTVHKEEENNPEHANEFSVKLELQADCFAGLWANSIKDLNVIQPGEINEAMDAAASVGDDRIQKKVQGQITPETWTHGSSEQRVNAFTRGFESGSLAGCNLL